MKIIQTENYVIVDNEDEKFVAIDNASGGYPYSTEDHPHIFHRKEHALEYVEMFSAENWTIYKMAYQLEEIL